MNHCILEVQVKGEPTIRYTQENKTPIAEMEVIFNGLRADDPPGEIKVVGWGNIADELKRTIKVGQKLVLEGRLRMNNVAREDGTKEKKAEFTLSRFHLPNTNSNNFSDQQKDLSSSNFQKTMNSNDQKQNSSEASIAIDQEERPLTWDSSPLIPDTDDIPF